MKWLLKLLIPLQVVIYCHNQMFAFMMTYVKIFWPELFDPSHIIKLWLEYIS